MVFMENKMEFVTLTFFETFTDRENADAVVVGFQAFCFHELKPAFDKLIRSDFAALYKSVDEESGIFMHRATLADKDGVNLVLIKAVSPLIENEGPPGVYLIFPESITLAETRIGLKPGQLSAMETYRNCIKIAEPVSGIAQDLKMLPDFESLVVRGSQPSPVLHPFRLERSIKFFDVNVGQPAPATIAGATKMVTHYQDLKDALSALVNMNLTRVCPQFAWDNGLPGFTDNVQVVTNDAANITVAFLRSVTNENPTQEQEGIFVHVNPNFPYSHSGIEIPNLSAQKSSYQIARFSNDRKKVIKLDHPLASLVKKTTDGKRKNVHKKGQGARKKGR
jgi:hypothetical protein